MKIFKTLTKKKGGWSEVYQLRAISDNPLVNLSVENVAKISK